MGEYIEREALLEKMKNWHEKVSLIACVTSMPAADVKPVVHGHWETNSDRPDTLICSVCKCGFDMWKHDPHNFCSNCGANLDIQDRGDNDAKSM